MSWLLCMLLLARASSSLIVSSASTSVGCRQGLFIKPQSWHQHQPGIFTTLTRLCVTDEATHSSSIPVKADLNRRKILVKSVAVLSTPVVWVLGDGGPAKAYTPDSDSLRESLYLLSRVQEATCLQERYIQKKSPPIQKMKLTLRLVDRSYRLLDQVNYISKFIPDDDIVVAAQLGNEAAASLEDAIDFVQSFKKDGSEMTNDQKEFLIAALIDTRERLFDFLGYLPNQGKLAEARARVEDENKLNADEFDPDLATDAGVYTPVVLPWKNR